MITFDILFLSSSCSLNEDPDSTRAAVNSNSNDLVVGYVRVRQRMCDIGEVGG